MSIMELSSIIKASPSRGLVSFLLNLKPWLPSLFTSSVLWIVMDLWCVASSIRFAARPVGAAHNTDNPCFLSILMIPLTVVVFPVPGPPVKINTSDLHAAIMASRCLSAYSRFFSSPSTLLPCSFLYFFT